MKRLLFVFAVLLSLMVSALWLFHGNRESVKSTISIQSALSDDNHASGYYARAIKPRPIIFPDDHLTHPNFKTEWWYFTGNVQSKDGRRFGYQLTFFRSAVAPFAETKKESVSSSLQRGDWSTNQVFMAHCAVTDVEKKVFYSDERFSRMTQGLAGCVPVQNDSMSGIRIWLENWSAETQKQTLTQQNSAMQKSSFPMLLQANIGSDVSFSFQIDSLKPTVLQGEQGLSRKGTTEGNASYYYSLTRLATKGILTIKGEQFDVDGASWMDREWSTSALEQDQVGWDWFALHCDDGREIMFYQLRKRLPNGKTTNDSASAGVIVESNGTSHQLAFADVLLEPIGEWANTVRANERAIKAKYPAQWRMTIAKENLQILLVPLVQNQELKTSVQYWEGAVRIEGTANKRYLSGYGYIEMTGYAQ